MYKILYKENNIVTILSDISHQEIEEIESAHKVVHRFIFYKRKFTEVELNYNDYLVKYNTYKKLSQSKGLDYSNIDTIFIDLNRVFINFISSFKFFIDYFDYRLEKKYSKDSDEYKIFEKLKTYNYETYFSYRLFYYLRNYSQHDDYPIQNFMEERNFGSNNKVIYREFKVEFNKDLLLKNSTIKAKLKDDLKGYGSSFPVLPLFEEILRPLQSFIPKIFEIEQNQLLEAHKILSRYFAFFEINKEITYGYQEKSNRYLIWKTKPIQKENIEKLINELDKYKMSNFT